MQPHPTGRFDNQVQGYSKYVLPRSHTCRASSSERHRRMVTQLLPSSPASGPLATLTSISSAATCE